MINLTIEPKSEGKGRSFSATLLASLEAGCLWKGGETDTHRLRPVWAMIAGSENELRPFMVNLTTGRKAIENKRGYSSHSDQYEFLKTAGYRVTYQKELEGSIATVFLPSLFQIDPGMVDPEGIQFAMLPPRAWVESQRIEHLAEMHDHIRELDYNLPDRLPFRDAAVMSYLFAAYLDRRTRCPLVSDGRFFLQLMIACFRHNLASNGAYMGRPDTYRGHGVEDVGLLPGLTFRAEHETFETLLAHEVARYFDAIKG